MTLIIGIKCKDGIVMGSDGAATLGTMGQRTIVQPIKKLEIISKSIILGVSGPIGIGQIFNGVIKNLWDKNKFHDKKESYEAMEFLRDSLWEHVSPEFQNASIAKKAIGNIALTSAICSTLIAIPISKKIRLFQFNQQCSPEEATENLPFVSIGSGQQIADPFLAFLRWIFWRNELPSLEDGILTVLWTLQHAIRTNPGGVSDPKQIITIKKENNKYKIYEFQEKELQEHSEEIYDIEKYLSDYPLKLKGDINSKEKIPDFQIK